MNITFTSRGEEISEAMKQYIREKLSKFDKILSKVTNVSIEFINESSHKGINSDMRLKIRFNYKGHFIEVSKEGYDFYVLADELEKLLKRRIEKLKK